MSFALWTAQVALAALFAASGFAKSTFSRERLRNSGQTGVQDQPMALVRFIGAAELCGAVGLVAPWATGIAPALTPLAALGLGTIMVLACGVHLHRGEPRNALVNLVLLAVCVFVAWGRRG